jgi:CDP-L-myo-inositol myo-inositolphosphotransferase
MTRVYCDTFAGYYYKMIEYAIILAAGKNTRLDTGKPKSLLQLGGISLLERHIRNFSKLGISHFCIVTGYQANTVEEAIPSLVERYNVNIMPVHNSKFNLENGYSVWYGLGKFKDYGAKRCILTMGDHVFQEAFVEQFISKASNADQFPLYLGVDKPGSHNEHVDLEDVTKVLVSQEGLIRRIGKEIEDYNYFDTGLFSLRTDVYKSFEKSFSKNEFSISDTVMRLAGEKLASTIEVSGFTWNDVDNPDDLNTSRSLDI